MNVFTNALVKFDPDFDPNIRSKSQIFKNPIIEELLTRYDY